MTPSTATSRPPTAASTRTGPARPQVRFRLRVTAGDAIAIGPGKIALLEAIVATGSITAAAKRLDMSYRRAWMLVDELNRALAKPAVDSVKGGTRGGGTEVTAVGLRLIALYRGIEDKAAQACKAEVARLMRMVAR